MTRPLHHIVGIYDGGPPPHRRPGAPLTTLTHARYAPRAALVSSWLVNRRPPAGTTPPRLPAVTTAAFVGWFTIAPTATAAGDRRDTTRSDRDCEPADDDPAPVPSSAEPSPEPTAPPSDPAPEQPGDAEPSPASPSGPAATPPSTAAEAMGRKPLRVKCLDQSLVDEFGRARVRKGVQPRRFEKRLHLAMALTGGGYGGDLVDTNWQAGANLAFWFSEDFGIDGEFRMVPMTLRLERAASGFTDANRYPDGLANTLAYIAHGHLLWSPIHTKMKAGKKSIVHGDFVFFAGAGKTFHDSVHGVGFDLGISYYLFPRPWLSWRFDLSDHILAQEALGSRRISNSLVFSTGVAFWIPFTKGGNG